MDNRIEMRVIAHMKSDLTTKFGIPRQNGLVPQLRSTIVFEPEYRDANAFRGLEEFSHIWVIWQFSEAVRETWSPTVRPPRLGGNQRLGVFATRSPFRPNAIGLSCVKLEKICYTANEGPVLYVSGADLMDGTPILDIKPYISYADAVPDAALGFTAQNSDYTLDVSIPEELLQKIPDSKREGLIGILSQDPRPAFQREPDRQYHLSYAGFQITFSVDRNTLSVSAIEAET